jgi:hypothetical protein
VAQPVGQPQQPVSAGSIQTAIPSPTSDGPDNGIPNNVIDPPPVKDVPPVNGGGLMGQAPDFVNLASSYASRRSVQPTATQVPERYEATSGEVSQDSLVENRIAGLMSMDNPAMQKAIINANNLSAQRGLQSSSIATENAINSMFNFATPIAQQDAQTYANQNLANQDREAQVGLQNNQAVNQQAINDAQNRFTATESAVQRGFTAELEQLKNQNNLGLLDRESQLRLVELERQNTLAKDQMQYSAGIQATRDQLLQTFQQENMDTEFVNQLQLIEEQARQNMAIQNNQNNFARQMEYSNAISAATNFGIEALGQAFLNPEITPDQYPAIQRNIMSMIQSQIANFQDIYGISTPDESAAPVAGDGPLVGPVQDPVYGGGTGGGSDGSIARPFPISGVLP